MKFNWIVTSLIVMGANSHAASLVERIGESSGAVQLNEAGSALSGVEINASKDSSLASIKLSKATSVTDNDGTANFSTFGAIISTPLVKSSDSTVLANFDGFSNSTSLNILFSKFIAHGKKKGVPDVSTIDLVCNKVYVKIIEQTGKEPENKNGCDSAQVAQYAADELHAFDSAFWDIKNSDRWIWGGNLKIGHQQSSFVRVPPLQKEEVTRTPWAVGAFLSYNPDRIRSIFTLGVRFQQSYNDKPSSTVCPSTAGAPYIYCLTGSVGEPVKSTQQLISFEGRKIFDSFGVGLLTRAIALAPAPNVR